MTLNQADGGKGGLELFVRNSDERLILFDGGGRIVAASRAAAAFAAEAAPPGADPGDVYAVLARALPGLRGLVERAPPTSATVVNRQFAAFEAGPQPVFCLVSVTQAGEGRYVCQIDDVLEEPFLIWSGQAQVPGAQSGACAALMVDAAGAVRLWGPDAERMLGRTAAEVVGRPMAEALGWTAPDEAAGRLERVRERGLHEEEIWVTRRDGARMLCSCVVGALEDAAGGGAGFLVLVRDVGLTRAIEDKLVEMATTDFLTGAANRRHFMEHLQQEVRRWRRYRQPFSVMLLDVDHFKAVNDTWGHEGGDRVLRELVAACRAKVRASDLVARIGGEEFAILLPATPLAGAALLADRIRRTVQDDLSVAVDGGAVRVTASVGVAEMGDDDADGPALLRRADGALYRAKAGGRNRVVAA